MRWAEIVRVRRRFINLERTALLNRSARLMLAALRMWRSKATTLTRCNKALTRLEKMLQRANLRTAMAQWRVGMVNASPLCNLIIIFSYHYFYFYVVDAELLLIPG